MASSLFLFLLVSLSLAFFCTTQADLIATVCSASSNPSFCNQVLRSDPRSGSANLQGLGHITIEKAKSAVQGTITAANSVKTGSNRELVETCVETCGDSIDNLNQCSKLLGSKAVGSVDDLKTKASAALTDVTTCDDEFDGGEPAKLKQASQRAEDLISVLLAVAARL